MLSLKRAWHIGLCMVLLAGSCTDSNPGPKGQPVVTAAGTPTGTASSATIGAAGGKIASADGLVTLDVPAGALEANTVISIQPITNTAPLGVAGVSYRFSPDGQKFKTPVKVLFKYSDGMLAGTPADLLWVVTQASDGSWQALRKSSVNATAKTVSGEIKHFSDWGLGKFLNMQLNPAAAFLKPKESVELKVSGFIASTDPDEELTPLVPLEPKGGGDDLEPLVPFEKRNSLFKLVKWNLSGEGTLTPNGWSATYTAPAKVPSKNPVAVNVELERYQDGKPAQLFSKALLVSNITIAEAGVLVVNFNGTEYRYQQTGGVTQVAAIAVDDEYVAWLGGNGTTGIPNFAFYRSLKSTGNHVHRCEEADDAVSHIVSREVNSNYFKEWYDDRGNLYCAPFSSNITEFGSKFGETITGTFSGSLYDAKGRLVPISGYFSLARIN